MDDSGEQHSEPLNDPLFRWERVERLRAGEEEEQEEDDPHLQWGYPLEGSPDSHHGERPSSDEFRDTGVGARVSIFWPEEQRWFEGFVSQKVPHATKADAWIHQIRYDDGDVQWHNLFQECKWRLLERAPAQDPSPPYGNGRGTRLCIKGSAFGGAKAPSPPARHAAIMKKKKKRSGRSTNWPTMSRQRGPTVTTEEVTLDKDGCPLLPEGVALREGFVLAWGTNAGQRRQYKAILIAVRPHFPPLLVKYVADENGSQNPLLLPEVRISYVNLGDVSPWIPLEERNPFMPKATLAAQNHAQNLAPGRDNSDDSDDNLPLPPWLARQSGAAVPPPLQISSSSLMHAFPTEESVIRASQEASEPERPTSSSAGDLRVVAESGEAITDAVDATDASTGGQTYKYTTVRILLRTPPIAPCGGRTFFNLNYTSSSSEDEDEDEDKDAVVPGAACQAHRPVLHSPSSSRSPTPTIALVCQLGEARLGLQVKVPPYSSGTRNTMM